VGQSKRDQRQSVEKARQLKPEFTGHEFSAGRRLGVERPGRCNQNRILAVGLIGNFFERRAEDEGKFEAGRPDDQENREGEGRRNEGRFRQKPGTARHRHERTQIDKHLSARRDLRDRLPDRRDLTAGQPNDPDCDQRQRKEKATCRFEVHSAPLKRRSQALPDNSKPLFEEPPAFFG